VVAVPTFPPSPAGQLKLDRYRTGFIILRSSSDYVHQGLVSVLAPHKQADGSWAGSPLFDPDVGCIHMGALANLATSWPVHSHPLDQAGSGEYLPLVVDFMSFNEVVDTLTRQVTRPHQTKCQGSVRYSIPWGTEVAHTFILLQAHTYLSSIQQPDALETKLAGSNRPGFSTWARVNFPVQAPYCNGAQPLPPARWGPARGHVPGPYPSTSWAALHIAINERIIVLNHLPQRITSARVASRIARFGHARSITLAYEPVRLGPLLNAVRLPGSLR